MIPPSHAFPSWYLGLDLGQHQGRTALATTELSWTHTGRDPVTFENIFEPTLHLCSLRRFQLGTSYSQYPGIVGKHMARICDHNRMRTTVTNTPIHLVIDAGGPGAPVVDEIRRAQLPAHLTPMLITGGTAPGYAANGFKTVPRRELISNLVLLLEHNILRWSSDLPRREALDYELLQLSAGTTHPETAGINDDLVMALAIAVWQAKTVSPQILQWSKGGEIRPRWSPQGPLF
jgi:hypothetical protein